MSEWHYVDGDGNQAGPIEEALLLQMQETQQIHHETLVWNPSLADWIPLGDAFPTQQQEAPLPSIPSNADPATEANPYAAPSSHTLGAHPALHYDDSEIQARPWIRYWARSFDMVLFAIGGSLIVGLMLGLINPEMALAAESIPEFIYQIGIGLVYGFVEPVMLMLTGTTVGKSLLSIRVLNQDGTKLSYAQGLKRYFHLFLAGMGLSVPLISLFTQIHSYNRLTNNGITEWDRSGAHHTLHRNIRWWKVLALIGILVAIISVFVGLVSLA